MKKLLAILFSVLFLSSAGGCEQAITHEGLNRFLVSDISDELSHTLAQDNPSNAASTASMNGKSDYLFSDDEFNEAKQQAELLTAHLVVDAIYNFNDGKKSFSNREINNFVLTTVRYLDDSQYLYHDFVNKTEDGLYLFSVNKVQQIVHEVFGMDDWVLDAGGADLRFNEDKQQYVTGLEFGIGRINSYQNLTSEIRKDTATIDTSFLLLESASIDGDPGWEEKGHYKFAFQIMHENERVFLRSLEMNTDTVN